MQRSSGSGFPRRGSFETGASIRPPRETAHPLSRCHSSALRPQSSDSRELPSAVPRNHYGAPYPSYIISESSSPSPLAIFLLSVGNINNVLNQQTSLETYTNFVQQQIMAQHENDPENFRETTPPSGLYPLDVTSTESPALRVLRQIRLSGKCVPSTWQTASSTDDRNPDFRSTTPRGQTVDNEKVIAEPEPKTPASERQDPLPRITLNGTTLNPELSNTLPSGEAAVLNLIGEIQAIRSTTPSPTRPSPTQSVPSSQNFNTFAPQHQASPGLSARYQQPMKPSRPRTPNNTRLPPRPSGLSDLTGKMHQQKLADSWARAKQPSAQSSLSNPKVTPSSYPNKMPPQYSPYQAHPLSYAAQQPKPTTESYTSPAARPIVNHRSSETACKPRTGPGSTVPVPRITPLVARPLPSQPDMSDGNVKKLVLDHRCDIISHL